jgi:sugar phosphate isomerase/epimerase
MQQRIIAVNSNTYHNFTLDEAVAGITAAGFRYIELTATKGWTEHVRYGMTFSELCRIKERLAAAELDVVALSGHCNLADRIRLQDFADNIRLAAFFGARYIVSSAGEAHIQDSVHSADSVVAENVRMLLPELEQNGLELVLETHGGHGSGMQVDRLVKMIDSPAVRINYDTANVVFYGDVDPAADLAQVVDDVAYLHIKDKAGGRQEWNFPALGKGSVDFPALFAVLDKAANRSPLSIEIEFTKEGAKDIGEVNRAVQDSAAYLKGLGYTL